MNHTFMFGGDRFGQTEDFFVTYRHIGGSALSPKAVAQAVLRSYAGFLLNYSKSEFNDNFPTLAETVRAYSEAPLDELQRVELVIAAHEVGVVPDWAARTICSLAQSHTLVVVSNVWAPSSHWSPEFARAGIASTFHSLVFSSDLRSIKPSKRPFLQALRTVGCAPEEVLFVGDSLERDIVPAKGLGMSTCWIAPHGEVAASDFRISSIAALVRQ